MYFAEPNRTGLGLCLNEGDHLGGAQQGQAEVRHCLAAG